MHVVEHYRLRFFFLKRLDVSTANNRDASSRKLTSPTDCSLHRDGDRPTGVRTESGPARMPGRHVPAGGGSFRVCCSVAGSRESSSGTFAPP